MPGASCSRIPTATWPDVYGERSLASKKNRRAGEGPKRRHDTASSAAGQHGGTPISRLLLAVYGVFVVAGLVIYGPALDGEFISDDWHYVERNEYVHTPSLDNLVAIWSPTSEVTLLVENYAPVHLMLHMVEWQLFAEKVLGYHVVNVLLHALAGVLLIPIFLRSRISRGAALLGAAAFVLHPANVESVAWISQLKSSSALVLSLLAILLHPRRPVLALLAFALALFAKPFAAFAWPIVALFGWRRYKDGESWQWRWLVAWGVVVIAFAGFEFAAFSQSSGLVPPLYEDLAVRYGMIFSLLLRYLLMSAFGFGLSTFHEPPPVALPFDPWLLGGLLATGLLCWRLLVSWRQEGDEPVYWLWAAISIAPLSGVLPLPYPMADRYLYFVLPGLIGAVLLAGRDTGPVLARHLGTRAGVARAVGRIAVALLLVHFAVSSHGRAAVFQSAETFMADAERNYPLGAAANTRRAHRAALRGDQDAAIAYLSAAHARGYNRVDNLLSDPAFGPMQNHPEFVRIKHAMADDWIARLSRDPAPAHYKARALAQAYIVKGEMEEALAVIVAASERPGPIADELRTDAEELRREIAMRRRLKESAGRKAPSPR